MSVPTPSREGGMTCIVCESREDVDAEYERCPLCLANYHEAAAFEGFLSPVFFHEDGSVR